MQNLLTGNLGLSLEYQRPNAELIGERLVLTVVLALFAFAITWIVAIPAGIYSAMHPRSALDYLLTVLNYIGVATPNFMLALVLMWGPSRTSACPSRVCSRLTTWRRRGARPASWTS